MGPRRRQGPYRQRTPCVLGCGAKRQPSEGKAQAEFGPGRCREGPRAGVKAGGPVSRWDSWTVTTRWGLSLPPRRTPHHSPSARSQGPREGGHRWGGGRPRGARARAPRSGPAAGAGPLRYEPPSDRGGRPTQGAALADPSSPRSPDCPVSLDPVHPSRACGFKARWEIWP